MVEPGTLSFGEVVRGTVDAAVTNVLPLSIYIVAMTAAGSAFELNYVDALYGDDSEAGVLALLQSSSALGTGIAGVLIFIVATLGQYFLWEAMMRNAGLGQGLGRHRYLAFVVQSILIVLASSFGFLLLIVPGLVMMARWSIAPALVVRSDLGMIDAMTRSWETVRGNSTPVILVHLALGAVVLLLSFVLGGMSSALNSPVTIVAGQLVSQFQAALGVAMGIFLYGRLYDDKEELVEVFA